MASRKDAVGFRVWKSCVQPTALGTAGQTCLSAVFADVCGRTRDEQWGQQVTFRGLSSGAWAECNQILKVAIAFNCVADSTFEWVQA